jgi:cytochrome c peroxidase
MKYHILIHFGAAAAGLLLAAAGAAGVPALPPPPRGLPAPWDPPSNPWSEAKAALGRRLFSDPLLSRDRTVSCSTCHPPEKAYADGRPLAVGIRGQAQGRNAPSLLNVAYVRRPFWDGRAAGLEEQAAIPILNPAEMDMTEEEVLSRLRGDPAYPPLFAKAFGGPGVDFGRVRAALAAFERTLLAGDSPFDRWWEGDASAMGEDAVRGFRLFMGRARCSTCHPVRQSYALLTDDGFHNTGAGEGAGKADPGRMGATKRPEDRGRFKTPTLRNVALTAPYMHDGSLRDLAAVVDFYDRGGEANPDLDPDLRPLALTGRERRDLVAFLEALTSPSYPQTGDGRDLLSRGEFRGARGRFLRDLEARPGDREALQGLAEASLGTRDPGDLDDAAERLAEAEGTGSAEARGRAAIWLGRVRGARAAAAEGEGDGPGAAAHRLDAALAFARARKAAPFLDDAYLEGAAAEEAAGRPAEAEGILTALHALREGRDPDALAARAGVRYRAAVALAREAGPPPPAEARALFLGAAEDSRAAAGLRPLGFEEALLLARSLHWLGEKAAAREAYLAAIPLSPASRAALTGMANLLRGPEWTAALEEGLRRSPDHPQALYFAGFDRMERKDLDGAERAFLRLAGVAPRDAMARVFLGRIARERGDRGRAFDLWIEALRLDPACGEAAADADGALRALPVEGWGDVEALHAGAVRLAGALGDPYMRVTVRNNAAFRIREAVSSFTSRGRGRMQWLVPGAPPEALAWMRRCAGLYEAAVADVPPEEAWDALPFATRWVYAGVLNDAGLMRHYFAEVQDLDAAERLYLAAFRITDGAYMDAYFYNLQFLYGFERPGNERRWYRLAVAAKDAILREDPSAEGGFAPDERKRAAAERDAERLRDVLGDKVADEVEREDLPR